MVEVMKQALEALETVFMPHHPAVIALRTAIAEAEVANCDSPSWCKQYNKCHRRVVNAPVLANCITQAEKRQPLEAVNAQLLEALEKLMYWDNGKPEYDDARVAIAAAKGEA